MMKPKNYLLSSILFFASLAALLIFLGEGKFRECWGPSETHDASYALTFHSEGKPMAMGPIEVVQGKFEGFISNILDQRFRVVGCVRPTGDLVFKKLESEDGLTMEASGRITENGEVEGTYRVDKREGRFYGSKGNQNTSPVRVTRFDGNYEMVFFRHGKQMAETRGEVKQGSFQTSITNMENQTFEVTGYVLEDGTLVFHSITDPLGQAVLAEGSIDQDSKSVKGMYRMPDASVGQFEGTYLGAQPYSGQAPLAN